MRAYLYLAAILPLLMNTGAYGEDKHDHKHDDEHRSLEAHEHGKSVLRIAIEGNQVKFELESPANDIVGFEHAAKTDEQKKAVKQALSVLENAENLFTPDKSAGCVKKDSEAEFELEGEHAAFHAHWSMECSQMPSLTNLNVTFFDAFSGAEEVEVEVEAVSSSGQVGIELHHDDKTIDLSQIVS